MPETMIDARHIYSLTDFLRNYKAHIAHLKETRAPEVLTINGRAEVVILDADSYQNLVERLHNMETINAVRAIMARSKSDDDAPVDPTELERRTNVMDELTAEAERLGLHS